MAGASPHPRRIGRYDIVGELARGGMAELFVARQHGFEGFTKHVVIKRVLPSLADNPEFAAMFIDEARLAATLAHQNIVQVYDVDQDPSGVFFAMELLRGADVGDLLRTTQGIPLAIALEVARGACAGLHYAHERAGPTGQPLELVHRDVSPQNLFVTFDGAVKLLDWGIAKAVHRISNHYTRSGTLRGKIPYMSPEQCRGQRLDRRSDVFSLGVVLWEMTVGERLFGARGESDFDVMKQIIEHDAPLPSSRVAAYPAELERIVARAMRRDPRERHPSADALQIELETFMRATSTWVSTRDLAAFMTATYPQRAAELRADPESLPQAGQLVRAPTAAGTPGRMTAELPIEHALATRPEPSGTEPSRPEPSRPSGAEAPRAATPPSAADAARATPPSAADAARASPPSAADAPPPRFAVRDAPPRRRTAAIAAITVGIAGALAIGYAVGRGGSGRSPDQAGSMTGSAAPDRTAPVTEDAEWFQPDDVLVSKKPYVGERLNYLRVAKPLRAPDHPGGRGLFLEAGGTELETEVWWSTRLARLDDLAVGRLVFCQSDGYSAGKRPATKAAARLGPWIIAKVTDVAELPQHVSVGGIVCDAAGVRVANESRGVAND